MKKLKIFTPYHVFTFDLPEDKYENFRVQFGWCSANGVGFSYQFGKSMIDIPKTIFEQTVIIIEDGI